MSFNQPSQIVNEIANTLGLPVSKESRLTFELKSYHIKTVLYKSQGWRVSIDRNGAYVAEFQYDYPYSRLYLFLPESHREYRLPKHIVPVFLYSLTLNRGVFGFMDRRTFTVPPPIKNTNLDKEFVNRVNNGGLLTVTDVIVENKSDDKIIIEDKFSRKTIEIPISCGNITVYGMPMFYADYIGCARPIRRGLLPYANYLPASILISDDRAVIQFIRRLEIPNYRHI